MLVYHADVTRTEIDQVSKRQDGNCTVTKALHTLPGALHKRSQKSTQLLYIYNYHDSESEAVNILNSIVC